MSTWNPESFSDFASRLKSDPSGASNALDLTVQFLNRQIASQGTAITALQAAPAGTTIKLQTNGTLNTLQTVLNLIAGTNITLTADGSGGVTFDVSGSGFGTVTSVGLSLPAIFSVSGSPVTTSGTLSATLASQSQNLVWASPNGAPGLPTFRALVAGDIPSLPYGTGTVTSFSAGTLTPLFTTSVATATTTPALSFSLSNAAAHKFFGNNTGSTAAPDFESIGTGDLPYTYSGNTTKLGTVAAGSLTSGHIATWDASGNLQDGGSPGGSGTVTSVGLSLPADFTVTGSPVTTSGTLTSAWANESANVVHAGPTSGAAAAPTWRALVSADIPLATSSVTGAVKPDNTTITISSGVISAVSATPGWTLLNHATASSVTHVDLDSLITSTYDTYVLVIDGMTWSGSASPILRFSTNNGVSFDTSSIYAWGANWGWPNSFAGKGATGQTAISFRDVATTLSAGGSLNATWYLRHCNSTSLHKTIGGVYDWGDSSLTIVQGTLGGRYESTTAVNALTITLGGVTTFSGDFLFYGMAK